jgi:3-oxoacyl-[acyl-carrier protein] reductase
MNTGSEMDFAHKTAIVTGATRGIGRAIVLELARRGCSVGFNYLSSRRQAETLSAEIEDLGGRSLSFQLDVSDITGAREMIRQVKEAFGRVDFLINNAGVVRDKAFYKQDGEDWKAVLDTNLTGVFNFSRAVITDMMKQTSGRILCMTSVSGLRGVVGQANYSAAKAGVIGFVHSLAKEVGPFGITVNAIAPGFIETDMIDALPDERKKSLTSMIPLRRLGRPEEVAKLVCFLLSEDACYITGQVIALDGGVSI